MVPLSTQSVLYCNLWLGFFDSMHTRCLVSRSKSRLFWASSEEHRHVNPEEPCRLQSYSRVKRAAVNAYVLTLNGRGESVGRVVGNGFGIKLSNCIKHSCCWKKYFNRLTKWIGATFHFKIRIGFKNKGTLVTLHQCILQMKRKKSWQYVFKCKLL